MRSRPPSAGTISTRSGSASAAPFASGARQRARHARAATIRRRRGARPSRRRSVADVRRGARQLSAATGDRAAAASAAIVASPRATTSTLPSGRVPPLTATAPPKSRPRRRAPSKPRLGEAQPAGGALDRRQARVHDEIVARELVLAGHAGASGRLRAAARASARACRARSRSSPSVKPPVMRRTGLDAMKRRNSAVGPSACRSRSSRGLRSPQAAACRPRTFASARAEDRCRCARRSPCGRARRAARPRCPRRAASPRAYSSTPLSRRADDAGTRPRPDRRTEIARGRRASAPARRRPGRPSDAAPAIARSCGPSSGRVRQVAVGERQVGAAELRGEVDRAAAASPASCTTRPRCR